MFRCTKEPSVCLCQNGLPKECWIMKEINNDTNTFKSHALRGATSTDVLKKVVWKEHMQKTGWKPAETLGENLLTTGKHAVPEDRRGRRRSGLPSSAKEPV